MNLQQAFLAFLLAGPLFATAQVSTDRIYLVGGDTLQGEITLEASKFLLFEHDRSGERYIPFTALNGYERAGRTVQMNQPPAPGTEEVADPDPAPDVQPTASAPVRRHPARTRLEQLATADWIPLEDFKCKERAFLNSYTFDDDSRALTRFFFEKRRNGFGLIAAGLVASFGVGVVQSMQQPAIDVNFEGVTFVEENFSPRRAVIGASFNVLTIVGIVKASRYSRKRLLRTLSEYNRTQAIPARYDDRLLDKHYVQ